MAQEGRSESRANTAVGWIKQTVDDLERHQIGGMTDRERALCTTLLHGLAAAGHITREGAAR
ncbi:MAG: hypothetical protein GEV11_26905 [Streptosporangiales bacterium]|nr:hypothetical protein [Streptosporangiales bacterium]